LSPKTQLASLKSKKIKDTISILYKKLNSRRKGRRGKDFKGIYSEKTSKNSTAKNLKVEQM